tara:strand:- start:4245 stop:4433 length:189 start_codon:yes stop_codon:yes gene_type:complete
MDKNTLKQADKWFHIHDINAFIHNASIYIDIGDFELELSKEEILYRAKEYVRLKKHNLIKQK